MGKPPEPTLERRWSKQKAYPKAEVQLVHSPLAGREQVAPAFSSHGPCWSWLLTRKTHLELHFADMQGNEPTMS